jgi:uncharacterized protein (TIGR03118 family)
MTRHTTIARFAAGTRVPMAACIATLLAACGGGSYNAAPPPAAVAVTLSVAPTSVVAGQSATLTWSAPAGASCAASGGWSGTQAASGTAVVTPAAAGTASYTITCTESGGIYGGGSSGSQNASLAVTAPSGYTTTPLVSDSNAGGGLVTDVSLVNPWGIAFGATSPSWVANNQTGSTTLYDGNGKAQPTSAPIVAHFAASTAGLPFAPTGIVNNTTTGFVVSAAGKSGAARFIFSGEGGMIAGWSPAVDAANVITIFTDLNGAVYKGLAIASNGTANFLYATDFHDGRVDVFDSSYVRQTPTATSFAFIDPTLPAGYAPFGIQALKTGAAGVAQIYVSYAQQSLPDRHDQVDGAGLGLVDVYDTNGVFIRRLVGTGDKLNAPWGLALAPADFGTLSGAVLVGNFGDGKVNGYNATSGAYVGTVANAAGAAFSVPGLWGIAFGNDAANQPHNTLFYAAGTNNEANGVYGRIDLGGPPVLNAPPVVAITAPGTQGAAGTVAVTATATAQVGIRNVQFFANGTLIGTATTSPYTVQWDTTTAPNATAVALTATALDVDGNVGTSPPKAVTVGSMTLAALQSSVFTPKCSGCHTGIGATLPGAQNLSDGNSFAALVGVASIEQPALKRVLAGDAANSYVIQKLEGAATITGVRMPAGGPYLDQPTIDQIKTWINNGAPNN